MHNMIAANLIDKKTKTPVHNSTYISCGMRG